ncbi:hypothetical protein M3936_00850 [Sutcliffiella horikoshii]|uniref:hypothetical protein n=1 Tax=Sutcliffiella horikoshii TaxID=79883 RepID=UPI00203DEFF8|nr:hypothetical protein [Sutcliffiella horikoshii]MCM3616117.1 hypothetical protein [Sutcliffiella horikoshii]
MAFGIRRGELQEWKEKVENGEIAFITHYWVHPRYKGITTVTKAGCCDVGKLIEWGRKYGLKEQLIHKRDHFPHFDLIGDVQREILQKEQQWEQIERFLK